MSLGYHEYVSHSKR